MNPTATTPTTTAPKPVAAHGNPRTHHHPNLLRHMPIHQPDQTPRGGHFLGFARATGTLAGHLYTAEKKQNKDAGQGHISRVAQGRESGLFAITFAFTRRLRAARIVACINGFRLGAR